MSTAVTNYQCPSCTGPLHFSAATGKLECEYCESSFTPEEIEQLYSPKVEQAEVNFTEKTEWTEDGLLQMVCPSCGAELICGKNDASVGCPYCGNPSVVPGQFSGMQKPDLIIPFSKTKDEAIEALKKHYKGRFLLPRSFKNQHHIEEIQGVYVPFWFYDGEASADVLFKCTRSRTYRSGDYRVTEMDHYDVFRAGRMQFSKVPVDASTRMPDGHMDAIEPYDYSEFKPFSTAYLPGFLANRYDVTPDECKPRAQERCCESVVNALRGTVNGYSGCTVGNKTTQMSFSKVEHGLLPVWMLYTKWKDKNYLFAMNGQTGKVVGDLPVSWVKLLSIFLSTSVALTALLSLFFE